MILSSIHSIRKRIIAIILFICTIIIGTGFIITTVTDINRIKTSLAEQAVVAAKLVGKSCVSALSFNYPETAQKNLTALESFPGMVNARLYDSSIKLFAVYNQDDSEFFTPPESISSAYLYKDGFLFLNEPVVYQNTTYGMIVLKINPQIERAIFIKVLIAFVLSICLLGVAYFLASVAQKIISGPILELARRSEQISEKADYNISLDHENKGEIGTLYNAFNRMIKRIRDREQERDLAQNDLLFKEQVIESSTGAVATTDLQGVVTYCNPAFISLFGYAGIGNIVGSSFSVFLKDRTQFETFLTSLARHKNCVIETKARHINTDGFDAIVSGDTIFNWNRQPESFVITVSDISELREKSRALEKENTLRSAHISISDRLWGIQNLDDLTNSLLIGLNQYIDFQIGAAYVPDDTGTFKLVGSYAVYDDNESAPSFKPGEGIVGQAALEQKVLQITDVPETYFKIASGSGKAFPRHILVVPFLYDESVIGVIELAAFNSFRPMAFEILERLNRTVAIAIHASQSNEKLQELLEKTQTQSEELLSQTEEMLTQQEELQQTNEELEEQTQLLEEQQTDIKKKNRELEKSSWLVEQKARDLEITSQYKSEFMANMSHELRTPLNSILLLSDVLTNNKEKNLSDKQINFAKNIHSSGSDLLALINSILDLSKIESGQMELFLEDVPLLEFQDIVERTFRPVAEQKKLGFSITVDKQLPREMITDKQKTEQILKNLLSNAFKFTSSGSISFSIHRPRKDDMQLPKSLLPETTIAFTVEDTGIGIPEEKIAIVFEAFKQVDGTISRKYGGTGLGLSISKEIARLLGGSIFLRSQPGKGSVFTLYLPDNQDSALKTIDHTDAGVSSKPAVQGKQVQSSLVPDIFENDSNSLYDDRFTIALEDKSVLIIEDDPGFTRILCDHAHEHGFKVILASDGEGGLHLADFYRPSAIILDLGLPGIDGWSVMDRLKTNLKTRHIPVHIISAHQIQSKAMKMGAIGFLTKPVSLEKLGKVFAKFKYILSKPMSHVLVIEDNEEQCQSIKDIIGSNGVEVSCAYSAEEAETLLRINPYDCLILDLNLPGVSGLELLSIIEKDEQLCALPVIVYTNHALSQEEKQTLKKYARNIIVKSVSTPERLLDETTLFLHRVEADMSDSNRQVLRQLYEKDSVFKGKKILLVDDDMRNVFALNNILEEKGLTIKVAKTGVEALLRLDEHPDINIVLMDIMMPEMDGYEAMKQIRKQNRFEKLPIIALTAKAMKGDRIKCIEAGANDYLSKPVDREKLLSMIRVWLY
ncbi:MAG: response regulator [Pseudomonadota bacterium]